MHISRLRQLQGTFAASFAAQLEENLVDLNVRSIS
jgi:hypothetical protein